MHHSGSNGDVGDRGCVFSEGGVELEAVDWLQLKLSPATGAVNGKDATGRVGKEPGKRHTAGSAPAQTADGAAPVDLPRDGHARTERHVPIGRHEPAINGA